jgi:hypothetical protein
LLANIDTEDRIKVGKFKMETTIIQFHLQPNYKILTSPALLLFGGHLVMVLYRWNRKAVVNLYRMLQQYHTTEAILWALL